MTVQSKSKHSEYQEEETLSHKTLERDDSKEKIGVDVTAILGNTVTSNFKSKKENKEFMESQTVDYQRSIQLNQMEMGDGVSVAGSKANKGTVESQNRQKAGLSNVSSHQSILNKLHSH